MRIIQYRARHYAEPTNNKGTTMNKKELASWSDYVVWSESTSDSAPSRRVFDSLSVSDRQTIKVEANRARLIRAKYEKEACRLRLVAKSKGW